MANGLMFPDIVGRFQQGQQLGTQQRLQREGEQRQSRLAALAQQAYGTQDANQRQGLIGQAVGVDPSAGFALGKQLGAQEDERTQRLVSNAKLLTSAPEAMRPALWQQVRTSIAQSGIIPESSLPLQYDDTVAQTAQALVQAYGGGQGGTPAQQRHQEWLLSQLPESDRPEALKYFAGLGSRPLQESYTWEQIETDQGPRWVQRGRLGTLGVRGVDGAEAPAQSGGGQQQTPQVQRALAMLAGTPGVTMTSGLRTPERNREVGGVTDSQHLAGTAGDYAVPPAQKAEFMAQARQLGFEAIDEGDHVHLELPSGGGSARPLTSAERKYAEELGQQAAQIEVLDQRGRIEAANAARKAAAEAAAKTQAEVTAKQGQRSRDAQQTLDLLDQAEQILPQATGSGAGAATDRVAGVLGISTPGAQATAQLNLIASQLVQKVPRFEGPQSNIDVQFYREAAGDLANPNLPVETRLAALRGMRALNQKYAGGGAAQQSRSSLPPGFSWED